mgnify:CR=1 FL=1
MSVNYGRPSAIVKRMPPPEDGLLFSVRRRGWIAARWDQILANLPPNRARRVSTGKALARNGRIRDLWFSPGFTNAEVYDDEPHTVTISIPLFDDEQWSQVTKILATNLSNLSMLLEGGFPKSLLRDFIKAGVNPFPTYNDLEGECSCEDFVTPCAHAAAVHLLMSDALDGDPFLLFTLRGKTREQLLSDMRSAWKDKRAVNTVEAVTEIAPPKTNWLTAPQELSTITFKFAPAMSAGQGLRALGPPPGENHLPSALTPHYEAGSSVAFDVAVSDTVDAKTIPRVVDSNQILLFQSEEGSTSPSEPIENLDEKIIDLLDTTDTLTEVEISARIGSTLKATQKALKQLLEMGMVFTTEDDSNTLWWLG